MTLRLCKLPSKDGVNDEYGWFDRETGRALSEGEVLLLDGTEYRWTAYYADGTTEEAVATFTPGGFLNAGDRYVLEQNITGGEHAGNYYPKSTALHAAKYDLAGSKRPRKFVGPQGETPDIVRIRFVSGTVVTEVHHEWILDELLDAKETHGVNLCGSEVLSGWLYGFGALEHVQAVHKANGAPCYWEYTDAERECASRAASRAALGILRHFGLVFPVRRLEWIYAGRDPGFEVQRQVNESPWMTLGALGKEVS